MPVSDLHSGTSVCKSGIRRLHKQMGLAAIIASATGAVAQPEALHVVGERSFLTGCISLGEVSGSSFLGILIENQGWENAVEEMKEQALALGATHLLVLNVTRTMTGSQGRGEAYRCPLKPEAPRQRER